MHQSLFSASETQQLPLSYHTVDYVLPEGTYTNGVRRATPPQPHDCASCGSLATDPNPAHLVDEIYLDCPRCGPAVPSDSDRSPESQLSLDVRQVFAEESARGSRRSSGTGAGRKKKHRSGRLEVRFEQEVALLLNGHSGDSVDIRRFETANERVELQLTLDCKERLREISHDRRNEVGRPYPQVQLIREALKKYAHNLESPRETERGELKARMELRLFPSELLLLDRAAEHWSLSRGEIAEACLLAYIGKF